MVRFRRCPACGASVKLENLDRHVAKAHPGRKVDLALSEEERRALKARRPRGSGLGQRERWLYPTVAVILVAAVVLGVLAFPPGQGPPAPEMAPLFELPSTTGERVRLAAFQGTVILLNFMSSSCQACHQETRDVLVPLHAVYGDRVAFLSVSVAFGGLADLPQDVHAFREAYGADWPYLLDDGTVTQAYEIGGTPTTFILRPNLAVHEVFVGAQSEEAFATSLNLLVGG